MNTQFANRVIDQVVDAFKIKFGTPSRETTKLWEWEISPNLGVDVEINIPTMDQFANIWVPYISKSLPLPTYVRKYGPGDGRHSNTYATKSLEKGKPALRFSVRTASEIDETIKYTQSLIS